MGEKRHVFCYELFVGAVRHVVAYFGKSYLRLGGLTAHQEKNQDLGATHYMRARIGLGRGGLSTIHGVGWGGSTRVALEEK